MAYTNNSLTAVPLALETSLEQVFTVTFEEVLNVSCPHLPLAAKGCSYQQDESFLHSTSTKPDAYPQVPFTNTRHWSLF